MTQKADSARFFTIGHSTRSFEEFVALLRPLDIELVADVRKIPASRTNPQFNSRELSAALLRFGISYEHIAALGGRRGKSPTVPAELNAFWKNQSFHNYADYALTHEFRGGLTRLLEVGGTSTCVIMCAEAVWWRCHRRIITDHLLASGEKVFHILGAGHVDPSRLTPGARITPDRSVHYPPRALHLQ